MAFGRRAAVPATAGCFGKLPTAGDFVSHGTDGREVQSLMAWLEAAAGGLRAKPVSESQVVRYLWPDPAGRGLLAGVLWPSADRAGRKFPFTTFLRLPQEVVGPAGGLLPLVAEPVWQHLLDAGARIRSAPPGPAQFQVLGEPPPPDAATPERAAETLRSAGAAPLDDGYAAGRLALQTCEFLRYCAALREEDPLPPFALRLRLASPSDVAAEAACWLRILERRLGRALPPFTLFLRMDPADGPQGPGAAAFVFARDMASADLPFVLAPADRYPHADSVGFRDAPADQEESAFRARFLERRAGMPAVWATLVHLGIDDGAGDDAYRERSPAAAAAAEPITGETAPEEEPEGDVTFTLDAPLAESAPGGAPPPLEFDEGTSGPPTAGPYFPGRDREGSRHRGVEDPGRTGEVAQAAAAFWGSASTSVPTVATAAPAPARDPRGGAGGDDDDPAGLVRRLRAMLEAPLLRGDVVEVPAEGPGAAPTVVVLRGRGPARAVPLPEPVDVADARSATERYAAARDLLDRLRDSNRELEKSLERELDDRAAAHGAQYLGDDPG